MLLRVVHIHSIPARLTRSAASSHWRSKIACSIHHELFQSEEDAFHAYAIASARRETGTATDRLSTLAPGGRACSNHSLATKWIRGSAHDGPAAPIGADQESSNLLCRHCSQGLLSFQRAKGLLLPRCAVSLYGGRASSIIGINRAGANRPAIDENYEDTPRRLQKAGPAGSERPVFSL